MSDAAKKFYLTTPIYYVNARPHIGHAYTTIVGDVLARRHRLLGFDTFFLTGTDEHGQKIERSAASAGIAPQQFADEVSNSFKTLWARMGITNDRYIRTTDAKHQNGAQALFRALHEKGFIYLSTYTGQYSVGEEMFVEGPPGTIGPDGKPTETVTEENFFFKLSAFQRPLIDLIESDTLRVENEARKNEVLSFLRGNVQAAVQTNLQSEVVNEERNTLLAAESFSAAPDSLDPTAPAGPWTLNPGTSIARSALGNPYVEGALKDLSVSRSSFTWGIPVPEPAASEASQKHIIYVWLDALANYMTAVGYGSTDPADQAEFERYWPADLHLVGKEIIRFHCVYWPAFLLAAGIPLPKAVTAHGWLLFDNSKMSKSKGNIVRTETILDAFGTLCPPKPTSPSGPSALGPEPSSHERDLFASDVLRYFLLREIPFGQDGSFSFDALITRYNADLANGYGNLVSRTLAMIQQNYAGIIPTPRFEDTPETPAAPDGFETYSVGKAGIALQARIQSLSTTDFTTILTDVAAFITVVDGFITSAAPWKLAKDPTDPLKAERLATVLYTSAEAIRWLTGILFPYIPSITAKVWAQLGLGDINDAARDGELAHLVWGGLPPGTKLGPLGPIFPRADKSLAETMINMENPETPSSLTPSTLTPQQNTPRPEAPLKSAFTPTPAQSVTNDTLDPAAPPRTFTEPDSATHVAGSAAHTTGSDPSLTTGNGQLTTPPTTPADASPQITIEDFIKIELRVARVLVAERIPKADKLLRLEVDLGPNMVPAKRQILSGIAEWYTPEDLIGRRIIVITNLAPRKMRGLESHGMLLAASEEGGKPFLATVPEGVPIGTRLK
jgi:methionyl-tRNA synthetase